MMYQLVIEPDAEDDLSEAYRWYENQRPGLGDEFIACVAAGLDRICETPLFVVVLVPFFSSLPVWAEG